MIVGPGTQLAPNAPNGTQLALNWHPTNKRVGRKTWALIAILV